METLLFLFWNVFYTIQKHFRKTFWFFFTYKWHPLKNISLAFTGRAYHKEKHNGMHIVAFRRLAVFDCDIPDPVHDQRCVTYESRKKIYSKIKWVSISKGLLFWVEETPGGVHIWLLSERLDLTVDRDRLRFHYLAKLLNADPFYRKICLGKRHTACRVSPKRRRSVFKEDKIAKFVGIYGDPFLVDRQCVQDFRFYLKYWSRLQDKETIEHVYGVLNSLESYLDY